MKSNYLNWDKIKYWRGSLLAMTVLSLATTLSFASISDCNYPVEVTLDRGVKMKFCKIPAGSAVIGSERYANSMPVGERHFKSFQMGQYHVTQKEYRVVAGLEPWLGFSNSKIFVENGDNNPAVHISYFQAKQFARRMSLFDPSANYRLPTDAEFEYAARAGTTTEYYWGDDIDPSYAYYFDNTIDSGHVGHSVLSCPDPALDMKFPGYCANGFGLMHMLGNAFQWTEDAYVPNYANAPTDGNVAVAGEAGSDRVVRGGSSMAPAYDVTSSVRFRVLPDHPDTLFGFRLVRTPKYDASIIECGIDEILNGTRSAPALGENRKGKGAPPAASLEGLSISSARKANPITIEDRIKDCAKLPGSSKKAKGFQWNLVSRERNQKTYKIYEVWKDSESQLVWGDRLDNQMMHDTDAVTMTDVGLAIDDKACKSEEGKRANTGIKEKTFGLPSSIEYKVAEEHGVRDVLPNMVDNLFWGLNSHAKNVGDLMWLFLGHNGDALSFRDCCPGCGSWFAAVRCVGR